MNPCGFCEQDLYGQDLYGQDLWLTLLKHVEPIQKAQEDCVDFDPPRFFQTDLETHRPLVVTIRMAVKESLGQIWSMQLCFQKM